MHLTPLKNYRFNLFQDITVANSGYPYLGKLLKIFDIHICISSAFCLSVCLCVSNKRQIIKTHFGVKNLISKFKTSQTEKNTIKKFDISFFYKSIDVN